MEALQSMWDAGCSASSAIAADTTLFNASKTQLNDVIGKSDELVQEPFPSEQGNEARVELCLANHARARLALKDTKTINKPQQAGFVRLMVDIAPPPPVQNI